MKTPNTDTFYAVISFPPYMKVHVSLKFVFTPNICSPKVRLQAFVKKIYVRWYKDNSS